MKHDNLVNKNIFWISKDATWKTWNVGFVHAVEGDMIQIGKDKSVVSELYNSNWYEIKDLKIKVRPKEEK